MPQNKRKWWKNIRVTSFAISGYRIATGVSESQKKNVGIINWIKDAKWPKQ